MESTSSSIIWGQAALSMVTFAVPLLFLSLSIGRVVCAHKVRNGGKKYPPYAPGGMWKDTKMKLSKPYWMLDVARTLETRVFQLAFPAIPPKSMVAVGETTAFRALLTDPLTKKPESLYGNYFRGIYGGTPTVFTTNGPEWHAKRKTIAPAFSSKHIKRMTSVALEKTEAWIQSTLHNDSVFDVSKEIIQIVLSALSETAFEYEMPAQEKDIFGRELKLVLVEFTHKAPVIPLRALLGRFIPERRRAEDAARRLKALVIKIMNAYRNKGPSNDGTIIQLIMESEAFPTEDEKAAQLLEFLVAGHDTTAYSIAFILTELARNPKEQTALRESLSQLSPEDWTSSQCLQRIVKEGMRLHPVGRSLRETGRDIMTSKNEVLPKGSLCIAHFLLLFRNPDIFEEPDSFLPSRWENPTREMLDSFHPFSMGRQNCVGQSLARAEIFGIVARICSEFELSVEDEGRVDFYLTIKPVGTRLRARKV